MAFINTPACAKAVLIYTLFSQECVNNIWFGGSSDYVLSQLDDLADAVALWWDTELKAVQSADIELDTIKTYDMSAVDGPTYELAVNTNATAVGAALPGQNALVVTFGTANRGRSGRGRNYIAGLRETDATGNLWSSTVRTNVADAYVALNSYVSTINSSEHVVVSFQRDGVTLSSGNKQPVLLYQARAGVKAIRARS